MKPSFEPINQDNYVPIRDTAYEILRNAILNGTLEPGTRMVERELANQLGISRTPIREAIRKLENEGLVTHIPRKGVVVTKVSIKEVIEIFNIRAALEGLAASHAAENINSKTAMKLRSLLEKMENALDAKQADLFKKLHLKFNDTIYLAADSPRLYQMIQTLVDYIANYTQAGYSYPGRQQEAQEEHRAVVDAIINKKPMLAEQIAKKHIENSKKAFLHVKENKF